MTAPIATALLPDLAPIGLDELTARASLQTRVDRKYVLLPGDAATALRLLPTGSQVLTVDGRTCFGYGSHYFDTPGLTSFHATATARRRRWKVRTRSYLDSGQCFLEVKTSGHRGLTIKQRREHHGADPELLSPAAADFVSGQLAHHGIGLAEPLADTPVLHTEYQRSTVVLPDGGTRVTIDTGLCWRSSDGIELGPGPVVVLETKSAGAPTIFDRALWRLGHRPRRISKFGTGMVLLHPELPDHRWHRLVTASPLTA